MVHEKQTDISADSILATEPVNNAKTFASSSALVDAEANDNRLPAARAAELKMLFVGDMMLDRHVGGKIKKNGLDSLFAGLTEPKTDFFGGYDLVGANLEGAVTDAGAHYPPENAYDFAFAPDLISQLQGYGFSYFNIANNHLSDQGKRGIIETGNNLEKMGFSFSGCADGKTGDCSTAKLKIKNLELGMIGFSLVAREPAEAEMKKIITDLASTTDLVIVNVHWGTEYTHIFSKRQQELGYLFIDSGADIVIGHHPHVVQGLEIYKSKPIFYSLGNFIFDQYFSADTQEELAAAFSWQQGKAVIRLIPLQSASSSPRPMEEAAKAKFLDKFIRWSVLDPAAAAQIKQGNFNL